MSDRLSAPAERLLRKVADLGRSAVYVVPKDDLPVARDLASLGLIESVPFPLGGLPDMWRITPAGLSALPILEPVEGEVR